MFKYYWNRKINLWGKAILVPLTLLTISPIIVNADPDGLEEYRLIGDLKIWSQAISVRDQVTYELEHPIEGHPVFKRKRSLMCNTPEGRKESPSQESNGTKCPHKGRFKYGFEDGFGSGNRAPLYGEEFPFFQIGEKAEASLFEKYCGKNAPKKLVGQVSATVPSPPSGLPLDEAREFKMKKIAEANGDSREYFLYVTEGDLRLLVENFVLVIPPKVQETLKLFNDHNDYADQRYRYFGYGFPQGCEDMWSWHGMCLTDPNSREELNCAEAKQFVEANCQHTKLLPSELVYSQYPLWDKYLTAFTTIRETAITSTKRSYEATLDLTNFCHYGQPIRSFLTREMPLTVMNPGNSSRQAISNRKLSSVQETVEGSTDTQARDPEKYCVGTRQKLAMKVLLTKVVKKPIPGVPLDYALTYRKNQTDAFRKFAAHYFFLSIPDFNEYTLILPKDVQTKVFGRPFVDQSIKYAVEERSKLWQYMALRYTTVKEAVNDDPDTLNFEIGLDLSLFCQYKRRVSDLVSR